jgi:hypothetical protein
MAGMAAALSEPLHVFDVEQATKFRWRVTYGNTIEELNGDEMFRAETPPIGTAIRYATSGESGGSVTIEIRATSGEILRTLEGPGEAGVHQVWWDLRSDATAEATQSRGSGTPSEWAYQQLVPFGSYSVTLRAGGRESRTMVKVRDEPLEGVRQVPLRR